MALVNLRFYAELNDLLAPSRRGREFAHEAMRGTSVKDLIEGLGVPHTEVDLVLVNGESVGFEHAVGDGDRISVYPVFESLDVGRATCVRTEPLREPRFVLDVHLGRLAVYLRLLGFDCAYRNDAVDDDLVELSVREHRIILTRDRGILKRSTVTHGYLVRATHPRAQLTEVLERFDLRERVAPFTRCTRCNGVLEPVTKEEVQGLVPPRSAAVQAGFWRCQGCGRVYWRGSHMRGLQALVDGSLAADAKVCDH